MVSRINVCPFIILIWINVHFLTPFLASAQPKNIRFEHIGTEAGLSQSNVICILQDSRGFMWFGTRDGLNKYDGYKITTYRSNSRDSTSISDNTINDIGEDSEGNLWIATWNGLSVFDRKKEKFTRYRNDPRNINSIASNLVNTVLVDRQKRIWIGLEGKGFDIIDQTTKRVRHFPAGSNSINSPIVKRIMQDDEGLIWLGTYGGGLSRLDPTTMKVTSFTHDPKNPLSISHNDVWGLFQDSKKRIWVGSMGGSLNVFDKRTGNFTRYKGRKANGTSLPDYIMTAREDYQGNIWVGAENGPLNILDPSGETWQTYSHDFSDDTSINNHSIWSIYRDSKGNMWVGTFSGGINFFNRDTDKFRHYQHNARPNSLSNNNVLSIVEDSRGYMWVGTDGGGLNRFYPRDGTFERFTAIPGKKNSLSGNYILSIAEDKNGNLWIGTWGNGITVFNPVKNTYRHYVHDPKKKESLGSNNAWTIFNDSEGSIWIGTYSAGLDRYDPATDAFVHYSYQGAEGQISHNMINMITEDSQKRLWVGTNGGGLNCFDRKTKTFKNYKHNDRSNSISNNVIFSMLEESPGNFWIGTGSGLNYFDSKSGHFINYYEEDGLPNETIFSITRDKKDNLWMGTNRGISRMDLKTKKFQNYTVADGLQSLEFKQAVCYSSSGKLYLGGINGFNEFHPDSVQEVAYDPNLVLTEFQLFNKPVNVADTDSPLKQSINETQSITLSHDQSVISFEFASLNYTSQEHKNYACMLEGFDKAWSDIGEKRNATYTNLPPGEYTFRVKGQDNLGRWSDTMIALKLSITPPFWQTRWFRLTSVLLITAAFITLYRIRIGMINKQKVHLEHLVKARTEELTASTQNERKAREEAERARLEAEQANKAKSIFLATMSHEIRTPMNGVIGMASLLNETSMSAEQREYTDAIRTSGENLLGVINDILDFSKIESGKMDLEQKDFDLRTCIEEVFDLFVSPASAAGIDLIYQLDYNVPPQVVGDGLRLRQILINLVGNAVKFTPKGEIFLQVRMVSATSDHAELSFEVRDTGIGIPPDKLERLFKPFSQVDSSTTRKYGGTGLGLAICEKLVSLMGGKISVTSRPDVGTTFHFTIVTGLSTKGIKTYVHAAPSGLEGKRILVVDDSATNRSIVQAQLEQWKFIPTIVSSAPEALAHLDKLPFDLVLTDMQMPEMDGVAMARSVKKNNPTIPIILLSSIGDERTPEFNSLFSAVLTKPAKLSLLYTHVINALRETKQPSAPEQSPTSKLPADFSKRHPMRVLIADDNPINQKLTEHIFIKMGYTPVIVGNGVQVLEALALAPFDIIMMDVQMPEMDGLEATRRARQLSEPQPVIVAMTANAMESDRERCLHAGMDDYLSKPIQLEQLVRIIEKWATQKR
jgi:signal transduction histidine kinase/CheY-like chemotaxis protein/ligand-binding sensor domain-containing protein